MRLQTSAGTALRAGLIGLAGLAVLHGLLNFPRRPVDAGIAPLLAAPLEPLIFAALAGLAAVFRGKAARIVAFILVALALWLGAADLLSYASFDRPADMLVDWRYLPHLVELMAGAFGWPLAAAYVAGAVLAYLVALLLAWWAIGAVQRAAAVRAFAAPAGLAALAALTLTIAWPPGERPVRLAVASGPVIDHGKSIWSRAGALAAFARAADADAYRAVDAAAVLPDLRGVDVLFVFVESYGHSALTDPRYADLALPVLAEGEVALAERGAAMASGWLTSPVQGGLSWLAHASALSGRWIDRQRDYDLMLASGHPTLVEDFARAGHRTAVVMPAITRAWPEAEAFGYDRRYFQRDLGYAGDPFNWVTMPDQYTLSAFERLELGTADRPPLMAEIALISSHAPWVPIPPVIDWDEVGDGRIFNRWANSGDPPAVVWRDFDRVRAQYRLAVAYSLETVLSFAARLERPTLMLVMGDHQPAPLITGQDAPRDVPLHVIATEEALVAPWLGAGFAAGLVPADGAPVHRMDALRGLIHRLYGTGASPPGSVTTAGLDRPAPHPDNPL